MNCPCCTSALKAEDGPHVVCPHGHRFYVAINHADHCLTLVLVADPTGSAKMPMGSRFIRTPVAA